MLKVIGKKQDIFGDLARTINTLARKSEPPLTLHRVLNIVPRIWRWTEA